MWKNKPEGTGDYFVWNPNYGAVQIASVDLEDDEPTVFVVGDDQTYHLKDFTFYMKIDLPLPPQ
jgi:hypothetical protein